jgi:hypothetical protein
LHRLDKGLLHFLGPLFGQEQVVVVVAPFALLQVVGVAFDAQVLVGLF